MSLFSKYSEWGVNVIEDKILVWSDEGQSFDKMKIVLAIRNSTYEDKLSFSLLKKVVLKTVSFVAYSFSVKN